MTILLTGFEPFGGARVNPSALLVDTLKKKGSCAEHAVATVLPTEFATAGKLITELLDEVRPVLALMFGVSGQAQRARLERLAVNIDHADIPDNRGDKRLNKKIRVDGQLAYETKLDLTKLQSELAARGHATDISHHAGTYVCNHVYYSALSHLAWQGRQIPILFVHIPEFSVDGPGQDAEIDAHVQLACDIVELIKP